MQKHSWLLFAKYNTLIFVQIFLVVQGPHFVFIGHSCVWYKKGIKKIVLFSNRKPAPERNVQGRSVALFDRLTLRHVVKLYRTTLLLREKRLFCVNVGESGYNTVM